MPSICHLTSVHPRYDARIFLKECCSLARLGYAVTLVVADGLGDEVKEGVHIIDVGKVPGRMKRMLQTTAHVFAQAKALECDLYHFHDPELLWVGWRLKRQGYGVIYDAHEDVPRQILAKSYIPLGLRKPLSWVVERFENRIATVLDAVVVPTPSIHQRFSKINENVAEVRNFPILEELTQAVSWDAREDRVCYVGAISETRGIEEMVKALDHYAIPLELAGNFRPPSLRDRVAVLSGWEHVHEHGFVGRQEVRGILGRVKVGLVTLHPTASYRDAIPVKMFEYMAAGIPFIASDFPFWRQLLEGWECGIFVDPMDSDAIAKAIKTLIEDQATAEQMGQCGKEAVEHTFNWQTEAQRLEVLYGRVLS